ncbi:hypothetical protein HanIR_Chr16g0788631 [Helianthus annuus]|nr:hypothetical protein HanIR_Chr16g0788631 [Helianthus annuus]
MTVDKKSATLSSSFICKVSKSLRRPCNLTAITFESPWYSVCSTSHDIFAVVDAAILENMMERVKPELYSV